jgi:heme/copper-type cytochrome/quinol oxidase subunit 1
LSLGAVFGIFTGVCLWWRTFFGVFFRRVLMLLFFFLIFLGVNLTFFPLHFSGLQGYPRKYLDFRDFHGLWNGVSSLGSVLRGFAVVVFIYLISVSCFSWYLFVYEEKSSSRLEGVFGGYVGFHRYSESVSFWLSCCLVII